jgi:putative protein-disulfide isomerase
LIYCYDAYCGWCYGFSPVIKKIADDFGDSMHIEVLSGGMILPDEPRSISIMAPYIAKAYKTVEERTGIKFGKDYLWHIFHPDETDWFPNSEKPAIALSIFKEYFPERQVEFATDLQYGHHFEGRDLTDDEAYRHLLQTYNIPDTEFYNKLKEPHYKEQAHYEFTLVKQLKVSGFPTLFVQADESRFFIVARGYTDYDMVKQNIANVLHSITNSSSS